MTLVNIRFIKPLDENLLIKLADKSLPIYTLEDNVYEGGFGSSILEFYNKNSIKVDIKIFAHSKGIITHGTVHDLMKMEKLDTDSLYRKIMSDVKVIKNETK